MASIMHRYISLHRSQGNHGYSTELMRIAFSSRSSHAASNTTLNVDISQQNIMYNVVDTVYHMNDSCVVSRLYTI